jgi:citrate lyase beta subunit
VTSSLHQPIHTVYGGAHLFKSTTCSKLGALAQKAFKDYAPDAATMAKVFGIDGLESLVHKRVTEKLGREPIEDYRIDFEDGFGVRSDAEEDAAADNAAREVSAAVQAKSLPRMFGIRVKSFHAEPSKQRARRTLDRFLSQATLPENFVVTLPKITAPEQVSELVRALQPYPDVCIEIMIETPGSIFILPQLLEAAQGKCLAAHFGAYDYMASLGITAASQDLHHPACDFARSMMLATLAETGVWLVDGATNLLPFPPEVHRAWKLHYDNIRHSLYNGFYQGWDLHPAQIPARLIAVQTFFLEGLAEASARLRNFRDQSEQATRAGAIFDDAATGRGLVNFFERAVRCGAIQESDVPK